MTQKWTVQLESSFLKSLKKLDRPVAQRVLDSLGRLENFENPQEHCKALTGNYSGLWRYRIGDYRAVIDFDGSQLVIIALELGHRSKIYS